MQQIKNPEQPYKEDFQELKAKALMWNQQLLKNSWQFVPIDTVLFRLVHESIYNEQFRDQFFSRLNDKVEQILDIYADKQNSVIITDTFEDVFEFVKLAIGPSHSIGKIYQDHQYAIGVNGNNEIRVDMITVSRKLDEKRSLFVFCISLSSISKSVDKNAYNILKHIGKSQTI